MSDFNIWPFLTNLSKGKFSHYDQMSDDGKKEVAPFVLMRWLSGTSDILQIKNLQRVNKYIFKIKDKAIQVRLLALNTTGKTLKYSWVKAPSNNNSSKPITCEVITKFYNCSLREAKGYLDRLSIEDIEKMADIVGIDSDDLKKLKKELK